MIHSGSRGLGYQVCDDALVMLRKAPDKYGIDLQEEYERKMRYNWTRAYRHGGKRL